MKTAMRCNYDIHNVRVTTLTSYVTCYNSYIILKVLQLLPHMLRVTTLTSYFKCYNSYIIRYVLQLLHNTLRVTTLT